MLSDHKEKDKKNPGQPISINYAQGSWQIDASVHDVCTTFFRTLTQKPYNGDLPDAMKTVLGKYIPTANLQTIETASTLSDVIKKFNDIAVRLQSVWWNWTLKKLPDEQNIARTTRLLLCRQMLNQFKDEANNAESTLTEEQINTIYKTILKNFDNQREWFSKPFNQEIEKLKTELKEVKEKHREVRSRVNGVEWELARIRERCKEESKESSGLIRKLELMRVDLLHLKKIISDNDKPKDDYVSKQTKDIIAKKTNEVILEIHKFINSNQLFIKSALDKIEIEIKGKSQLSDSIVLSNALCQIYTLEKHKDKLLNISKIIKESEEPISNLVNRIEPLKVKILALINSPKKSIIEEKKSASLKKKSEKSTSSTQEKLYKQKLFPPTPPPSPASPRLVSPGKETADAIQNEAKQYLEKHLENTVKNINNALRGFKYPNPFDEKNYETQRNMLVKFEFISKRGYNMTLREKSKNTFKILALLSVIDAIAHYKGNPNEENFKLIKNRVQAAVNHLKRNKDTGIYGTPNEYCNVLESIASKVGIEAGLRSASRKGVDPRFPRILS